MIHADFETRSDVDLAGSGVYVYSSGKNTDVLMLAWYDQSTGEVKLWKRGDHLPADLFAMVRRGEKIAAWNAQFERVIWNRIAVRYGFPEVPIENWHCVLAQASYAGFPMSLAKAADFFYAAERKDIAGSELMKRMSRPAGWSDGRPQWYEDPLSMERLGEYCIQDVRTEMALASLLPRLPDHEVRVYQLDQRINDRGVRADWPLVSFLRDVAIYVQDEVNATIEKLTDGAVDSITKVAKLAKWFRDRGTDLRSCSANDLRELLSRDDVPNDVRKVAQLRVESARSSVAKLDAMLAYRDPVDDRMHGLLQYHGAATGRWAGRGPQPQNLPRVTMPEFKQVFSMVTDACEKGLNPSTAAKLFSLVAPPLEVVSQSLRRCIIPGNGNVFYGGDYAGVEARMLAWLANQTDLVEKFRNGVDVYVDMASRIYGVPGDQVTKEQRRVGKIAILGLGYGMGWSKFQDTAKKAGVHLTDEESETTVRIYRGVHYSITDFWRQINRTAVQAVQTGYAQVIDYPVEISWETVGDWLTLELPSGRRLWYYRPRLEEGIYGYDVVVQAYSSVTKGVQEVRLYGGLLTENVVQALCRDLLVHSLLELEKAGFQPVLSIHDEVLCEAPPSEDGILDFEWTLSRKPDWAERFPLKTEIWSASRYEK